MMNRSVHTLWVIVLVALLAACSSATTDQVIEDEPITVSTGSNPIVIGDVSSLVDETTAFYQPLANYMAENLADQGITNGLVRVAPNLETMAQWLAEGEVDVYIDSLYPSVFVSQASESQLVLRHWRSFVEEYHSVFFVLNDSEITTLDDLQGNIVAFDKVGSTSGWFLPTTYLIENGYNPIEVTDVNTSLSNEVGYIFADDDVNILNWVITGRVQAGVTNDIVFNDLSDDVQAGLRIIAETETAPSQIVSLREGLTEDLQRAIIAVMSNMESNDEGLAVLQAIETTRFDALPIDSETYTSQVLDKLSLVRGEQ
ncbi:MAG: phosphate/phosphite/phosphonate ABC transporter substrate-binding protein [Phototrophicaceae bacterium]